MPTVRPLESTDGPVVERLFGANGACGGCWCMYWHIPGGRAFSAGKGEAHRQALMARIAAGQTRGLLAFEGGEAVGWAAVGPRGSYARVAGHRTLQRVAGEGTWCIPCFYVPARHRGKGVARAMLDAAGPYAAACGATELEGYPVRAEGRLSAAFAYTGTEPLFAAAGFRPLDRPGRPIWVRALAGPR